MNDAQYHMHITTGDITPSDGAHLTIAGLRKQAALEWRVLGYSATSATRKSANANQVAAARIQLRAK